LTALRRPRTLAVIAAAVAFAAAALFLAVVLLGDDGEPSPGPLGTDEVQSSGFSHEVGRDFTFGLPVAFNRGDEPAVLERISLIDPTPGLKVIATRVAGPDRRIFFFAAEPYWPPREITDLHPVRGFEVAPQDEPDGDRGVELVFGARADQPGRYRTHGVRIDYRVGDTEHRATLRNVFRVCVLPEGVPVDVPGGRRCPAPKL
jgi:hypothetical protein